jgi:hypothetical protein
LRQNECGHPERPHKARGQCNACYLKGLKERNPETAAKQQQNLERWIASPENKLRANAHQRASRSRKGRRPHLKYGITREEYDTYLAQSCGICGEPSVRLDHCHRTGRVRGGLCHRCNLGLGYYEGWFLENKEAILKWVAEEFTTSG